MPLTHDSCVAALRGETATVSALAASADLAAVVPSCPGWRVSDLVGHLGGVHRWVTEVVRTGEAAEVPLPPAGDDLLSWFDEGAAALVDALAGCDPQRDCWTLAPPHQIGFWSRRQLQETMVHRWDLEGALGVSGTFAPDRAADGVDEVVTMLFPRQVRRGRQAALTDALALVDDGSGRRWVVSGDGTAPADDADATVTGDAVPLLLVLWKRLDLAASGLRVDGDIGTAQRVLGGRLTP